jgi:hypothetical protein
MTTDAALRRESRTNFINATTLNRKSGGAKWRDLCVDALSWKCVSTERTRISYFTELKNNNVCGSA